MVGDSETDRLPDEEAAYARVAWRINVERKNPLVQDLDCVWQRTLNPIPHIRREPFGMVIVPIVSFFLGSMVGWASAPYDPLWQRRYPRRAAWMALAGPAANFSLMLIAGITLRLNFRYGWLHRGGSSSSGESFVLTALAIFFSLNLLLGTFNLLPFPPLDGSSAITLLMPEARALRHLDWISQG